MTSKLSGHAVECRLYAEDPANQFFPSPGKILSRRAPSGPGIRFDDGVYEGFTVSTEYDPMLGKLIAWGTGPRGGDCAPRARALEEHSVTGIKTNSGLLLGILRDPEFLRGEIFTRWLDEKLPHLLAGMQTSKNATRPPKMRRFSRRCCIPSARRTRRPANGAAAETESRWKREARLEQVDRSE